MRKQTIFDSAEALGIGKDVLYFAGRSPRGAKGHKAFHFSLKAPRRSHMPQSLHAEFDCGGRLLVNPVGHEDNHKLMANVVGEIPTKQNRRYRQVGLLRSQFGALEANKIVGAKYVRLPRSDLASLPRKGKRIRHSRFG